MRIAVVIWGVALALLAAGCGSSDDTAAPGGESPGARAAQGPQPPATGPAETDAAGEAADALERLENDPGGLAFGWSTDFSKHTVPFSEIQSGGPGKDGIPAIDAPKFVTTQEANAWLERREPVIELVIEDDARAYPLQILIWHEIANDEVGGVPVALTFCPLCHTTIVFDRRLDGRVLDFGVSGNLRNSDLVMYDRQTESWWQQFAGEAIVGELTWRRLALLSSRLESWAEFRARAPMGKVLVPNDPGARDYGVNPYAGYDSRTRPYDFYDGPLPEEVAPLSRVVSLADRREAWSLDLLRARREIRAADGTLIRWEPGQSSALDAALIVDGTDVGSVTATRNGQDVPYFVDFAFAFRAFQPNAPIHHLPDEPQ